METGRRFWDGVAAGAGLMGVVNVTPDSFSDGGRFAGVEEAVAHGRRLAAEGAAIVDVGGESTRPGAEPVAPEVEIERVLPVVRGLAGLPVSVDTRRAAVAAAALGAGASLVNDVGAGRDPEMFGVVAGARAGILLLHMRGDPQTMQEDPRYGDVVGEVEAFLLGRAQAAEQAGVARERILIDPGIGFGKSLGHNLALLRELPRLAAHGYPVAIGVSRKRLLGDLTGRPLAERSAATVATTAIAVLLGAALVRVHEIAPNLDALRVAAQWRRGSL